MRITVDPGSLSASSKFSTKTGVVSIIVTVLLIVVFTRLGLWQMDRAVEKRAMLAAKELAASASPLLTINEQIRIEDIEYRHVKLSGIYDYSRQFLLDNRIHKQQAGYEVITPFYPQQSDGFILVNRGWVGHNGNRDDKPSIPVATASNVLTGVMTNPSRGFAMGPALEDTAGAQNGSGDGAVREQKWPLVLQYIDYATIADKVDKLPLVSGVVVAGQGQNGNLIFNWKPVANGPMKHYGYAFQWFAMLAAVIVLFIYLNFVKNTDE